MLTAAELMAQGKNPFVAARIDDIDGTSEPEYELKFGLIVYTSYPFGPKRARALFDLYMGRFGSRIKQYVVTSPGFLVEDFGPGMEAYFRNVLLPRLRQGVRWGYGFDDGNAFDTYLFMFHGMRPVTQKGWASFVRFEFPWNIDPAEVKQLAIEINALIPYESGFGGYFFKPAIDSAAAYDKMYAVTQRFWGVDAWNLEVSVRHLLEGYQSVNWLTLIGSALGQRDPEAVERARRAATAFVDSPHGTVLQAAPSPVLGDRNKREPMPGYFAVAEALRPLQLDSFESFGGEQWDDDNSLAWIRRFTGG